MRLQHLGAEGGERLAGRFFSLLQDHAGSAEQLQELFDFRLKLGVAVVNQLMQLDQPQLDLLAGVLLKSVLRHFRQPEQGGHLGELLGGWREVDRAAHLLQGDVVDLLAELEPLNLQLSLQLLGTHPLHLGAQGHLAELSISLEELHRSTVRFLFIHPHSVLFKQSSQISYGLFHQLAVFCRLLCKFTEVNVDPGNVRAVQSAPRENVVLLHETALPFQGAGEGKEYPEVSGYQGIVAAVMQNLGAGDLPHVGG